MKKTIILFFAVLSVLLAGGCSATADADTPPAIVGQWIGYDNTVADLDFTFNSDGTYTESVSQDAGKYTAQGNQLLFASEVSSPGKIIEFAYAISDNQLTMTNSDDFSRVLEKQ